MRTFLILIILAAGFSSCAKFLEDKPDKSKVVPHTLDDFQSLLDDAYTLNQGAPSAGEIASDNLLVTTTDWLSHSNTTGRNAYVWSRDVFLEDDNDWSWPYHWILQVNVALEGLEKLAPAPADRLRWNNTKGAALFYRALAFYQLAQEFCKTYDSATAATDPGLALRLSPDINQPSVRSSVQQTYDRILADLTEAATLLPAAPLYKTRPSKAAAFALLARTSLVTGNYPAALRYADSALSYQSTLLDYNTLSPAAANPVPRFNTEVIWQCTNFGMSILVPPTAKVDTSLYKSYQANDLRKTIYYKPVNGGYDGFYGSYDGTSALFFGLAVDEVYFIRAEANASLNNTTAAMDDLNTVLSKRWMTATFVPLTASNPQQALQVVLAERRKELVFRGLRWSDLRRLNKKPATQQVITRVVNNQTLTLPPGDSRYTFPIPAKVIGMSGMQQNP